MFSNDLLAPDDIIHNAILNSVKSNIMNAQGDMAYGFMCSLHCMLLM